MNEAEGVYRGHSCDRTRTLNAKRRSLWLARLRRADLDTNRADIRVCGAHFVSGRPSKLWEETNPDWAPSLLLGYGSRHADPARYDRAKRRRLQKDEADAASAAVSAAIAESIGTDTGDAVEGQPPPGDEDESGTEENAPGVAAQTELTSVGLQALETQCLALNEALYTARSENEQLQLSKAAFQGCEAKVIFYTGMPNFTQLNSLFELLESHVSHNVNNSLSKFQEFILFLMKLKLNLHNVDLGFRFGVSEATVCRTFDKWLHCAVGGEHTTISHAQDPHLQGTIS
ncbi:uncharacterized protein LOC125947190 [Dermacentor silvarum]|uniref:uncharacterized protein LOC125947190 n=1 Tax=Dermacentor silvarum TaxID=543639 RepID=UPI002100DFBB|nr:uncharacterized protein LOC125947190 [Dermacentor silvarum]